MEVSKFNEKLNKIDGNTYVIEEVVDVINGVYEAELAHDNVNLTTLNVYTGSKLTGDKVNMYASSTPSLTPWKTVIKIFSNVTPLYISYETSGDTVEAEDVNKLQDAVLDTQNALNYEIKRAGDSEKLLTDNLNAEISRAKSSESTITNNLSSEISRAKSSEDTLTKNLSSEITRAGNAESTLTTNLNNEVIRGKAAESTLTTNLANEVSRASSAESTITDNLTAEVNRANKAESTLTSNLNITNNNLNNEIIRAKDVESTLTTNLANEVSRASSAESTITNNLSTEVNRATKVENTLINNLNTTNDNLNNETARAKDVESTLTTNLANEVSRASSAEITITNNLNSEITRAKAAENNVTGDLTTEVNRAIKAESTITSTINTNKPNWDDKYTKNEVDNKISQVVSNMDWKESVATYADIATTYLTPDDGWTVNVKDTDITYRYSGSAWIAISANSIPLASSSVDGKMSKQDKIDHDDMNSKKHTHANKSIIDIITQTLIDNWNVAYTHISDVIKHITSTERTNWNTAYTDTHTHSNKSVLDGIASALIANWNNAYIHISDTIKHITSDERTLWNTVSNKVDKITGKNLSTNDFDNTYKSKVDGISVNSKKVSSSTTNGNIKIDDTETVVYTHPGTGTNPHGTTNVDVGLGNITNDAQVKRNEMGVASGVATLDSFGVNNQPPKAHTHDDRYYAESEIDSKITTINASIGSKANISHTHTKSQITDMPSKISEFTNDVGYITATDVDTSQNHIHANKTILDTITQTLIDTWNSAYTHISDTIKHITSAERTLWNTVSNKVDKVTGKSLIADTEITRLASVTNYTHPSTHSPSIIAQDASNRFVTDTEKSTWNSKGDMVKSIYDTNNDGIIDNADKLDGKHASDFAQSGYIGTTDLDTITLSGMYRLDAGNANAPSAVGYGQLLVMHGSADTITQIVSDYGSGSMYWRSGSPTNVGGSGTWGAWRKLWHDGNLNPTSIAGVVNSVVLRDVNGYIANTWFNSNRGSENTAAAQYLYDTGDGYMRKKDLANVRTEMVTTPFGLGGLAIDISSLDCNNIVNTGFYRGNSCTNRCPGSHTWTYLMVMGHDSGSWISQIGINYNNDGTYVRTKINGTWSSWRRLDATATSQITNDSGFITSSANVATATKLATTRTINGVSFDGTANIIIKDDTKVPKGCTWNELEGV